jgi:hypothetical protein
MHKPMLVRDSAPHRQLRDYSSATTLARVIPSMKVEPADRAHFPRI